MVFPVKLCHWICKDVVFGKTLYRRLLRANRFQYSIFWFHIQTFFPFSRTIFETNAGSRTTSRWRTQETSIRPQFSTPRRNFQLKCRSWGTTTPRELRNSRRNSASTWAVVQADSHQFWLPRGLHRSATSSLEEQKNLRRAQGGRRRG